MSIKEKIFMALAKVFGMTLETADGKQLELEKESGEPVVGDAVVSEDGEYLMPDGTTIVVEESKITEIRPAEEVVDDPAERGEELDDKLEVDEQLSEKDAEIDRLKAQLAEKDAEIDRLRKELDDAKSNAKSDTDKRILNMVAVGGGEEWLKSVKSQGKVDKRDTKSTAMDKMQAKGSEERISLVEYRKRKAERKAQAKK